MVARYVTAKVGKRTYRIPEMWLVGDDARREGFIEPGDSSLG